MKSCDGSLGWRSGISHSLIYREQRPPFNQINLLSHVHLNHVSEEMTLCKREKLGNKALRLTATWQTLGNSNTKDSLGGELSLWHVDWARTQGYCKSGSGDRAK